ncbi:glycosyltransferase [Patescibacteria group bacterium]|nr:glycosyltransferase [Patescibacteria group bacterium]
MKILIISHMYPSTFNDVSGIFVHHQARELIKIGCEVKVVSPVPLAVFPITLLSSKWKAYLEIPKSNIIDGIEVYYPRYICFPKGYFFEYSGYFMYLGIRKIVDKIYKQYKFDLIQAHVALPDGYATMCFNKRYKKPLIVTVHGQDLQHTLYRNKKARESLRQVFLIADKIITVSSKLRDIALNAFPFCNDKIFVINNGIPIEAITRNECQSRDGCKRKTIISVSFLTPAKGIDLNLKAISVLIKKYPSIKYVVIGDGLEMEKLKRLIIDLGLNGCVEFLGQLDHNETMKKIAESDIFSLPSWNEGFGVVYLEAMAFGKPVIACAGEGITDVIEHGKNGFLVKPKDVEDLVKTIDYILSNPEECKKIGKLAQQTVIENYTWKKNAERTLTIYEEVVQNAK